MSAASFPACAGGRFPRAAGRDRGLQRPPLQRTEQQASTLQQTASAWKSSPAPCARARRTANRLRCSRRPGGVARAPAPCGVVEGMAKIDAAPAHGRYHRDHQGLAFGPTSSRSMRRWKPAGGDSGRGFAVVASECVRSRALGRCARKSAPPSAVGQRSRRQQAGRARRQGIDEIDERAGSERADRAHRGCLGAERQR